MILCTACHKRLTPDEYRDHLIAHRLESHLQISDSASPELLRNSAQSLGSSRPNTRIEVASLPRMRRSIRAPPSPDNYLETRAATLQHAPTTPKSEPIRRNTIERHKSRSKSRHRKKPKESTKENCTICLGRMKKSQKLKFLPCAHKFHEKCIEIWLRNSKVCPLCRQG